MINFIIVKKTNSKKAYKKMNVAQLKKIISNQNNKVWIDIQKPNKWDINYLRNIFKIHELALEDCIEPNQRTKIDDYNSHLFINIHPIIYNKEIKIRDFKIIIGTNYIITVHLNGIKNVNNVKRKILGSEDDEMKPDHILYMLSDSIVDEYLHILDKIEDEIEEIENGYTYCCEFLYYTVRRRCTMKAPVVRSSRHIPARPH